RSCPGHYPRLYESNNPMSETDVNYEQLPQGMAMDETDISLRAHFANMSDEKLAEYVSTWTDEQLMDWDKDSFKDDGTLFLVCTERDVDIAEYRAVLTEHIRFRFAKTK